jgi:hypothetical protein
LITTHAQVTITNNGNQKEIQAPALILHQAGSYHIMDTQEIGNNDDLGYCIFFSEQAIKQVPASVLQADSLLTDQCLILTLNDEQCQKLTTYAELLYTESSNEKQLLLLLLLLVLMVFHQHPTQTHNLSFLTTFLSEYCPSCQ